MRIPSSRGTVYLDEGRGAYESVDRRDDVCVCVCVCVSDRCIVFESGRCITYIEGSHLRAKGSVWLAVTFYHRE